MRNSLVRYENHYGVYLLVSISLVVDYDVAHLVLSIITTVIFNVFRVTFLVV